MATEDGSYRAATEGGSDRRILTIPNGITLVRLLCVPVFVWLTVWAGHLVTGAVLLGVLGATDWIDGFLARRLHQVSMLGKVLDPAADRFLVASGVAAGLVTNAVPAWLVAVVLARETLVTLAVVVLWALKAGRVDVSFVGKAGTFAIMFAFPAFLLSYGKASWQQPFHVFAWICAFAGLTLGWIAVATYVPVTVCALRTRNQGAGDGLPDASRLDSAPATGP